MKALYNINLKKGAFLLLSGRKLAIVFLMGFLLAFVGQGSSLEHRNDSLLQILDAALSQQHYYDNIKSEKIRRLQSESNRAMTDSDKFIALSNLFKEIKNFSMDQTCAIAEHSRRVANRIGNDSIIWLSMLMQAEAEKGFGQYLKSIEILDSLPPEAHKLFRKEILLRYCSAYYSLEENTLPRSAAAPYKQKLLAYRDTLAQTLTNPNDRIINEIEYYKLIGDNKHAIDRYKTYIASFPDDSLWRPMYDFSVGEAYLANGNTEEAKYYLLNTAINDITHSVRNYNALPTLARMLYKEGDYEHAYNYIMHSLMAVKESQAQSRLLRVLEALPIIADTYNKNRSEEMHQRNILIIWISILALLVIGMLVFAFSRNSKLKKEQIKIDEKKQELTVLNGQVEDLNNKLRRSIREKEDRIGDLFNLCMEYINIMSSNNANAIKLVKKGATPAQIEKQLNEMQNGYRLTSFFEKFDKILLSIFPDFVAKVNALFEADYQFSPPPGQLTPELRIFALIRLGFSDTAKIASFLHFSPQTVYNYRFRARNRSIIGKDELIEAIRTL